MDGSAPVRPTVIIPIVLAAISVGIGLSFGACTQDDAFISFRYAEHLSMGHGLVYNLGDPVEGFTNLSWTVMLAGLMWAGAEPVVASILMGLVFLGLGVFATWHLARAAGLCGTGAGVAALLVALDVQLALESVEGLETTLFMVLLTAGLTTALRSQAGASSGWYALALLTRPEGALAWALTQVGLGAQTLRGMVRRTVGGVVRGWPVLLVLLLLTLGRLLYFGDPLPNTFYAKTGGLAVGRGLAYILAHGLDHPVLWLLLVFGLLQPSAHRRTLGVVGFGYLGYVVLIGGDFKPTGRFVAPVLPVLSVFAATGFMWMLGKLSRAKVVVWGLLLLALGGTRTVQYEQAAGWAAERHANLEARRLVGDWIAEHTPADTVLAIHSAGAIPFYAGRKTIDMWGLTDRTIARTKVADMGQGMAGHERSAPAYVFSLKPDLYLPEDKVFTLHPWDLVVEPGFPADFADAYTSVNIPIKGRWLNLWVRRDGVLGRR